MGVTCLETVLLWGSWPQPGWVLFRLIAVGLQAVWHSALGGLESGCLGVLHLIWCSPCPRESAPNVAVEMVFCILSGSVNFLGVQYIL